MPADSRTPSSQTLAQGTDWAIWEVNCTLGPGDRPYEERHGFTSIAAVLNGTFQYRSSNGSELLYPGSFLLGNAGTCFECGHEHGTGDRCVSFGFAPALFEEIAATCAGTSRFRFASPRLPLSPATTPMLAEVASKAFAADRDTAEEYAIGLAERIVRTTASMPARTRAPSPRDQRRITDVVRHIEAHYREPLDLAALASVARMSKYHFLRTFRNAVAATPHQYLLAVRLRRSAERLQATDDAVATIAADAGFGDLSTFYAHFRRAFGHSPQARRARR